jgi:uncharacterized iron-regulated membrane protein
MSFKNINRKIHKWASITIVLPLLIILLSGMLLLVKKHFNFIQPTTQVGESITPSITFDNVLKIAKQIDIAQIHTWKDIDRLDVRPNKGIIKIRSKNNIEIQIDHSTGNVLKVEKRNYELIESIHDGTFFQKNANIWLMLPISIITLVMLIAGFIMFFQPYFKTNYRK